MTAPSSSPATDLEPYLAPTRFIESEHPAVRSFVREAIGEMPGPGAGAEARREIAVRLFDAVRDGVRYDPYTGHTRPEIYPASSTLATVA